MNRRLLLVIACCFSLLAGLAAAQPPNLATADSIGGLERPDGVPSSSVRGNNGRVPPRFARIMPRVSGLAVTVVNTSPNLVGGYDANIEIAATTTRTYARSFTFFSVGFYFAGVPNTLLLGDNDTEFVYGPAPYFTLSPGLGAANLFTATTPNPSSPPATAFSGIQFANFSESILRFNSGFITALSADLPLPAITFGDGSSNSQLTLRSPYGTQAGSTTGGRVSVSRRWRGAFSHAYTDDGPHTITVASGCCSPEVDTGSPARGGNVVPTTGTLNYNASSASFIIIGNGDVSAVQGAFNYPAFSQTTTYTRANLASGSFIYAGGRTPTYNVAYTGTPLDQVTATAGAAPPASVLEVPTAGTWGLGLLALGLGVIGITVLRRTL